VIQGLQKIFLHTLTYHHTSNKFYAVMQGKKTVQELMNELTKYAAARRVHTPVAIGISVALDTAQRSPQKGLQRRG
jgi:hypothetical protein